MLAERNIATGLPLAVEKLSNLSPSRAGSVIPAQAGTQYASPHRGRGRRCPRHRRVRGPLCPSCASRNPGRKPGSPLSWQCRGSGRRTRQSFSGRRVARTFRHASPALGTRFSILLGTLSIFLEVCFSLLLAPPSLLLGTPFFWGNPFPLFWGNSLTRSSQRFFLYHRT